MSNENSRGAYPAPLGSQRRRSNRNDCPCVLQAAAMQKIPMPSDCFMFINCTLLRSTTLASRERCTSKSLEDDIRTWAQSSYRTSGEYGVFTSPSGGFRFKIQRFKV